MQRLQRPHLIFGDALGTLKVIDVNIDAMTADPAKDGGGRFLLHLAAFDGGKQCINLRLV